MRKRGAARGEARTAPRASLTVHAGPRPLPELLTLAAAASRSGTSLSFTGTETRPIEDLVRLAVAGGEAVSFGGDVRARIDEAEEPEAGPRPGGLRRFLSRFAAR